MAILPRIPQVGADTDALTAALLYVGAGLDIGPLLQGSKNPGSVLGSWPTKTFNDAQNAAAWYAGTDYGIFLHCGRCGLAVLDVDHPDEVPAQWWPVLDAAPFQRSRPDARRGHYVFAVPPGRRIGNSAHAWGEVRGENGVIVLTPTRHADADAGARYEWVRTGPVQPLDEIVARTLPDGGDRRSTISDRALRAWRDHYSTGARAPHLARLPLDKYVTSVRAGGSRHDAAVRAAATMARDIAAGLYPAWYLDTLETLFRGGFRPEELARGRGSDTEWSGITAWAVAQATPAEVDAVRARVLGPVPTVCPSPFDCDPTGAASWLTGDES